MSSDQLNYFATSIIASLTAFSLYKVFATQSKISSTSKLIKKVKQLPIKSADDQFVAGQNVIVKGNVKRNQKDHRNDKIVRQSSSKKSVEDYVIYIKFKEAIYSNQNFTNKEQYYVNLQQILGRADISFNPSFLISGPKKSITINNYDQSNYSSILQIIKWENLKRRLTLTQKFESVMLSYFRAIGTLVVTDRGRPGFLRGIDVGTRQVETGLKVGASIMALGTIGISLDGQIFLQPHLLFKDRLSIVANLSDVLKNNEDSRNVWFVIFILGGIYVGRRAYKYQQKHDIISKIKNWWKNVTKKQ